MTTDMHLRYMRHQVSKIPRHQRHIQIIISMRKITGVSFIDFFKFQGLFEPGVSGSHKLKSTVNIYPLIENVIENGIIL